MIQIQQDWSELRNSPIDIYEIEKKVRKFYNHLIFDETSGEEFLIEIYDAKSELESARILVRNLIKIETNEYVQDFKEAYTNMLENIGRIEFKLDELEKEKLKLRDTQKIVQKYANQEFRLIHSPTIIDYIRRLNTICEHLIYYPLKKAYLKFKQEEIKDKDGNKIIKDENLYAYFLFLELYHSTESLGNIFSISSPQKVERTKTDVGKDVNKFDEPSSNPRNPRTYEEQERVLEEEVNSNLQSFFNKKSEENHEFT